MAWPNQEETLVCNTGSVPLHQMKEEGTSPPSELRIWQNQKSSWQILWIWPLSQNSMNMWPFLKWWYLWSLHSGSGAFLFEPQDPSTWDLDWDNFTASLSRTGCPVDFFLHERIKKRVCSGGCFQTMYGLNYLACCSRFPHFNYNITKITIFCLLN